MSYTACKTTHQDLFITDYTFYADLRDYVKNTFTGYADEAVLPENAKK